MSTANVVVGSVVGQPDSTVVLPIIIDSQGQKVVAFNVNLSYNPAALLNPVGLAGPALPTGWTITSNSPTPGDLRFVGLTLGDADVLTSKVIVAQFDIALTAPKGSSSVDVALADLSGPGDAFEVFTASGEVVVSQPPNGVIILGLPNDVVATDVTPSNFKGLVDATVQLTAIATFIDDTTLDVTDTLIWASNDDAVAVVDAVGLVTITGVGDVRITGRFP